MRLPGYFSYYEILKGNILFKCFGKVTLNKMLDFF